MRMPGDDEGWGDMDAAPSTPRMTINILRAIETNDVVMQLNKVQKWSLTYAYMYPGLPKGMVLRVMKKWVGRPVSWKVFCEQLEIGRYRVAAILR